MEKLDREIMFPLIRSQFVEISIGEVDLYLNELDFDFVMKCLADKTKDSFLRKLEHELLLRESKARTINTLD